MLRNNSSHQTPRWRKIVTLVFLPIFIIIWLAGWFLVCLGSQKCSSQKKEKNVITIRTYVPTKAKLVEESPKQKIIYEQELTA